MTILPWVWKYLYKEDPLTALDVAKSKGTCNGGPRYGQAITLAEHMLHVLNNRYIKSLGPFQKYVSYDVGNAFAEAHGTQ